MIANDLSYGIEDNKPVPCQTNGILYPPGEIVSSCDIKPGNEIYFRYKEFDKSEKVKGKAGGKGGLVVPKRNIAAEKSTYNEVKENGKVSWKGGSVVTKRNVTSMKAKKAEKVVPTTDRRNTMVMKITSEGAGLEDGFDDR